VPSAFREKLCEWSARLRAEERTFEQIREATRQLIVVMRNMSGDVEAPIDTGWELGNLDEEWRAAVQALTEDKILRLRAICETACAPPPGLPVHFRASAK
jgi:hypothetical protein